MIFAHEGGVRAGKSYEAVLYHIVEAVNAGRHVYFRLNGVAENVEHLAAYVEKPVEDVRALLHPMGNNEVHEWLVCDSENDGSLTFPHVEKHALVVVDEAHEYWPVGRAALPDRVANFFAKHGHISLDIVVITQDVKELHRSIVRRVTKKNFYAKLDSLGRDQEYSVRFYSSPAPGKFELIGSERRRYDPAVWVLYHGVQPGVEGNEVYKTNTRNLWQTAKKPVILFSVALLVGLGFLARFFMGGGLAPEPKQEPVAAAPLPGQWEPPAPEVVPAPVVKPVEPEEPEVKRPAGIAYVLELAKSARPRYLGDIGRHVLVEFRQLGAQQVADRMTGEQLEALGWVVEKTAYGLLATWGDDTLIFTAWPNDPIGQQSQAQTEHIRAAAGPPVLSASETQPAPAAPVGVGGGSSSYGGATEHSFPTMPRRTAKAL